ncbi:MAG: ACT domain-containing protein [Ignavibacteriales bacterium]|nr:ACT domain-containing protein [Ignavibacteriaceae bacterium]NLH60799.1 ACT domain-containing protein [Ignavibacteriales bacterium]HOJ18029.1 ACT domain-containing protein [Ignavibacteriaceae bacterium]HPO56225.1 ACT domain-containing protein [Ignavibacteriaceae bacterium]
MTLTEEKIRELTLKAIHDLGAKATPTLVKEYIERELANADNGIRSNNSTGTSNRVILTSFGVNNTGIVSAITKILSDTGCDLLDISQKIMQEFYTLIMIVDISNMTKDLKELQDLMNTIATQLKIKIYLQHEDVFRFMHRI